MNIHLVRYLTLPMLLTPLLPLLGSRKKSSRLAHVVFSSAVVVVMTSTCYEPLTFHLAISAVALWTLMEQFYMPDEFGIDQFRRAVFLGIAVVTTIAVSQTQGDASFLFGFPKLLPFFELYRRTVIMSCIMTIYFTMMPLARPAYSSYVIVIIADALATLRSVISETSVDGTTEFHLGSIALMLSYYMGQLLAVPSRSGKPDIGPPSQPELPQVPNSI
ncbi:Hypothetical protein NTJ_11579 [Nesidiocoris tenuis]|uniref:Alpha-1,3-glucosyltransferase n=1 Tax=Nesidiocoris tenuis TaxID=355587 RepID=A0ABN7B4H6_9HEMI|nr:Hypothetical protein NTJ_11579 [Nesidiocoris tenuis]